MTDGSRRSSASRISLISTVLNEAGNLESLLRSLERQTLAPNEVIIVDGGSTDGGLEMLRACQRTLPLTVLVAPGANISQGRNAGLAAASGEIVAVVDAGVRLDPQWLERIVAPLQSGGPSVDAVGGFFLPEVGSDFELALAASTLPDEIEIHPTSFLPSSRSLAFRRSWFVAGVRYPEWLDYCEDLIFDLRLKRAGAMLAFQPEARVWYRPRSSLGAFWRQYYRYARGDGKAGLFTRRHLIRYATYLLVLPSLFVVRSWWWRGLIALGAAWYMRQPIARLSRRHPNTAPAARLRLIALAAGLRFVGDVAKMVGYPAGLIWRARRYGLRKDWRTIREQGTD